MTELIVNLNKQINEHKSKAMKSFTLAAACVIGGLAIASCGLGLQNSALYYAGLIAIVGSSIPLNKGFKHRLNEALASAERIAVEQQITLENDSVDDLAHVETPVFKLRRPMTP